MSARRGFFRTVNKYKSRRVEVDGLTFDSKREAKRYGELKQFERAGLVRDIMCQPAFPCTVNGRKVCTYKADFAYEEKQGDGKWVMVYEDVKSPATARNAYYRLKMRLVRALYPEADIREVY